MRERLIPTACAAALLLGIGACHLGPKKQGPDQKTPKQLAAESAERIRKACASDATYDRLKELVFDEAARIRNADARNLDPLAAASVVRMEAPLVKSRDDNLNVTVCTGRFILELPPGAENAFDGMRRLDANVEYAAQAAADGSGLVYQMDGAEPIIYRLASFGLKGAKPMPQIVAVPQPSAPPAAPPQVAVVEPMAPPVPAASTRPAQAPAAAPRPPRTTVAAAPRPAPAAADRAPVPAVSATRPSFNCRYGKSRSERLVCGSPRLAASDRAMSSIYYSSIAGAPPEVKRQMRASRDQFLSRRERCRTEECVASAYQQRIAEIRRIAGD
jgi:hypothetical protein